MNDNRIPYVLVPLVTKGYVAIIDADQEELVTRYRWYFIPRMSGRNGYAFRVRTKAEIAESPGPASMLMHRLILDAAPGAHTDHINGNGLDNRRANLRPCTRSQNMANYERTNARKWRGVFQRTAGGRWTAEIGLNRKKIHLGNYETPEEAAMAYDRAALLHHGEFAILNFPEPPSSNMVAR